MTTPTRQRGKPTPEEPRATRARTATTRERTARESSKREAPSKEVRAARRRNLVWSLAVLTGFALLLLGVAMSPLLDIEEVQVVGASSPEHVTEIRHASGLADGDPIVMFRTGSAAAKVDDLPWIASAKVTRDLPNIVRVTVTERTPVAWVKAGSRAVVVDGSGRVLWRVDAAPAGLPEMLGVADIADPGGLVRPVVLPAVAAALGPDLGSRAASVQLDDGAVTVQMANGPQLRFGAPRQVAAKARVAAAVLVALGPNPVSYIDVTVPAAPVSG
jgi:cell division protein FtsQ